jgi:hypothetical protein
MVDLCNLNYVRQGVSRYFTNKKKEYLKVKINVRNKSKPILFADDTSIIVTNSNPQRLYK